MDIKNTLIKIAFILIVSNSALAQFGITIGLSGLSGKIEPVFSGATFNCETTQSGEWDSPSTWSGCNGGFPNTADMHVIIKDGHSINFDLQTVVVYGFLMESNSVLTAPNSTSSYDLIAEGNDINTQNGKIISDSRLEFTANNGNIILGSIESLGLNDGIIVQASKDIIVTDTISGFNVFSFIAESTDPLAKIIIEEEINTVHNQIYNSLLHIEKSVKLSSRIMQINEGLNLANHSLEINIVSLGNSHNESYINGQVTATDAELVKLGIGTLNIDIIVPPEVKTIVNAGKLIVNGQIEGPVTLNAVSEISGIGEISSSLTMNDMSSLSPGTNSSASHYGVFQVNNLFMNQNSSLNFLIAGDSVGVDYDQILVNSNVQLSGNIQVSVTHPYDYDEEIIIIDNQSQNAINGVFNGINEGDIIFENFQISYQGGDGNDLTITPICAENITVTNNSDTGSGSFRAAIDKVCDNSSINFDDAYTINLLSTISLSKDVVIEGSGQVFESSISDSLFNIGIDAFVRLNNVTIQNTNTNTGAITNFGTFTMYEALFQNNNNSGVNGGGAISNFGTIAIEKVSFYQNNANKGGAIHVGIPDELNSSTYIANSTFYQNGNLNTIQGGAIYSEYYINLRSVTIIDSGDGSASNGNSIYLSGDSALMQIDNSLIASSNPSISECATINSATVTSFPNSANYFIDDGTCDATFSGNPKVGEWGSYGGFAPTIPLLAGSPAINNGSYLYCSLINFLDDQIGNQRTIGIACDIGAVEYVDTDFPEVLMVSENNQIINECSNISYEVNTFHVTFNERVIGAENTSNYDLVHAGLDQSFQTSDDIILQPLSAVSDGQIMTPTITLAFQENIGDGLVRLYVDSDITDEFYQPLYDGNNYELQFRIDSGNLLQGGHFDDCGNLADFPEWQIIGDDVSASDDIDDSNASFSFKKLVTNTDSFSISQCVNVGLADRISMDAYFKGNLEELPLENSNNGNSLFEIEMSCQQFDDTECNGNFLETLSMTDNGFAPTSQWGNVSNNLGTPNPLTMSVACEIEVTPIDSSNYEFYIDKIKLFLIHDVIFSNGFE